MYSWQTHETHRGGRENFGDKFLSTFPNASKPFSLRQPFQPAHALVSRYPKVHKDGCFFDFHLSGADDSSIPGAPQIRNRLTWYPLDGKRFREKVSDQKIFHFLRHVIPGAQQIHRILSFLRIEFIYFICFYAWNL